MIPQPDPELVNQLIDWAALLFSGIALAISYRVWRQQKRVLSYQIAAHERADRERTEARLEIRLRRGGDGARVVIKNVGAAAARNVSLQFDPDTAPVDLAGLEQPIPVLKAGSSYTAMVLLSGQDPDQFAGEIQWDDDSGPRRDQFVISTL